MTWYTFRSFVRNRLLASSWTSFHSPYLFNLFSYCCDDRIRYDAFARIEAVRGDLLRNKSLVERNDLGSGSVFGGKNKKIQVSRMARQALSLPFQCRFLSRLVHHKKAETILEFGTSLGISASYLQAGNPSASISTIEGDPEIAKLAQVTCATAGMKKIHIINSSFEHYISAMPPGGEKIDLFFLDGNHQSRALLAYYEQLKHRFTSDTIVVVDDIHWSRDMYAGWSRLIALPEITQSVDCFQFGLLFFRTEFLEKEHHYIRLPWKSIYRL